MYRYTLEELDDIVSELDAELSIYAEFLTRQCDVVETAEALYIEALNANAPDILIYACNYTDAMALAERLHEVGSELADELEYVQYYRQTQKLLEIMEAQQRAFAA